MEARCGSIRSSAGETTVTAIFRLIRPCIATPRNDRTHHIRARAIERDGDRAIDGRSRFADRPRHVITLSGDLGAGKTSAARANDPISRGDDALEVPSPTFTLVQSYDLPPFRWSMPIFTGQRSVELEEIGLSPLPEGTLR